MKKLLTALVLSSALLTSSFASAEDVTHETFGEQIDLGVPDGVAVGFVVSPVVPWLRLDLAGTYNFLAPGVRIGATLDPVHSWISPSLTIEGGTTWAGSVPMVSNSPNFSYQYANFHLGLEFGKRDSIRFFIQGGPSYIDGHVANLGPFINQSGVSIADAKVSGFVVPTVKIGLVAFVF